MMGTITSVGNKYVKRLRDLAKARSGDSCFPVEGKNHVAEIGDDWEIESFALSESFVAQNDITSLRARSDVFILADNVFKSISDTVSPQGIMAVCVKKSPDAIVFSAPGGLYLVCDRISDPGNMGTVIRNAHAFGCDALIVSENSVDIYNPKIIRASAGSFFKINFQSGINLESMVKIFEANGVEIITTHPAGKKAISEVDFTRKCAIVIGNEANGASDFIVSKSSELAKIPMPGNFESLNASVACGIVLYEAVRQRNKK